MSQPASVPFHHHTSCAFTPRIGPPYFFCIVLCKSHVFFCLFADLIKRPRALAAVVSRTGESKQLWPNGMDRSNFHSDMRF